MPDATRLDARHGCRERGLDLLLGPSRADDLLRHRLALRLAAWGIPTPGLPVCRQVPQRQSEAAA